MTSVPVIDIGALGAAGDIASVARTIDRAASDFGFFSIVNHGVDRALCERLEMLAREFFARPTEEKQRVAMIHGGTAWRGWFPLHGELTSGTPDHKEGYYFGRELPRDDPRVRSGLALHGPNLWPAVPSELRATGLEYLAALETVGHRLTRAISLGLGFSADELRDRWFRDPLTLLRLFRYPPGGPGAPARGVAEHTDYGFLTLLWQDGTGGLEVRTDQGWIDVTPDPNAFVCNIGDMLERLSGGRYRSTPHRVRSPATNDRIAIPFFFDPDWDARIDAPASTDQVPDDAATRWDETSVHAFDGTYGEYLMGKVGKVFPELGAQVLAPIAPD